MKRLLLVCCWYADFACAQADTVSLVSIQSSFTSNYGTFFSSTVSGNFTFLDTACVGIDTFSIRCNEDSFSYYGMDSAKLHYVGAYDLLYGGVNWHNDWIYVTDSSSCNLRFITINGLNSQYLYIQIDVELWFHSPTVVWNLIIPGDTVYYDTDNYIDNNNDTSYLYRARLYQYIKRSACCVESYTNPPVLSLESNRVDICNDTATVTAQGAFSHFSWSTGDSTRSISVANVGTYTCTASNGCVSDTASIIIISRPCCNRIENTQVVAICAEDSFYFNNQFLSQSGTYFDTLQSVQGCDSFIRFQLTVNPPLQENISKTICSGNSYLFNGAQLTQSGIYKDTLQTAQGCDSIVALTLTVNPPLQENISKTICSGNSYLFNGNQLTQSGVYKDSLQNEQGCDSIVTLTLTINPPLQNNISKTICAGNSVFFNGTNYTSSGTYSDTLQNAQGCDSIASLTLTVLPIAHSNVAQTICEGDVFLFNGMPLLQSGTYIDTIQTLNACKVTTLALTVAPLPELVPAQNYFEIEAGDSVTLSACASGDFYEWLTSTGSVTEKKANNSVFSASPKVPLQTYTCIISNETGCADTCVYTVKVNGVYGNIYVPNAFSPNGDGINDVFQIFGKYIRLQNLTIFNRWGEKVFVSTSINETWDGTYKGIAQATGVYPYELTYFSGIQNEAEHLKGTITLIR